MSGKNMGIVALVCGIFGVVGSFFAGWTIVPVLALIAAIAGIILGACGMKASKLAGEPTGLAVAGLVLGIIGTVFAFIGTICAICVCTVAQEYNNAVNALNNYSSLYNLY